MAATSEHPVHPGNVVLLVFNTSTPTREEQEHQCLCAIFFFSFCWLVSSFKLLRKAERCDVCVWSVWIFAYRGPNIKFKRYFLGLPGGKAEVYDDLVAVRETAAESSEKPRGSLEFA